MLLTALALLGAALLAPAAHAANFTVNTLVDGADANAGNGVCQTSTPGQCTFRAAVQEANALSSDDTIDFSVSGVHPITSGAGGPVTMGTSGGGNLTVIGNGPSSFGTVLDVGGASGVPYALNVNSSGSQSVSLAGLVVRGVNSPGSGGGIISSGGSLSLNLVIVTGNTGGFGSGVSSSGGALNILQSTIATNTSTSGSPGGGIAASGSSFSLVKSTVAGNSAAGGGAGVYTSVPGAVIANSTISGNSSAGHEAIRSDSSLTLRNTTIGSNAPTNNAVLALGAVNLGNTIVAGAGTACQTGGSGSLTSAGNNIAIDASCGLTQPTDKPSTNPQLAPLAYNGDGTNETMAIAKTSPAFDAGSAALCAAAPVNNMDERGFSRPQFSACDIGSFELENIVFPPNTGKTPHPDNSFRFGKLKLKPSGTAVLPVSVPGMGTVAAFDTKKMLKRKLIKRTSAHPTGASTVRLKLRPTARGKQTLADGKALKTTLRITFTPSGGSTNKKPLHVKLTKK
jgi:CSLREA domain-containing protein